MLLFLNIKHYILWKIRAATYFLSTSNSYDQNPRTNTSTPPKKNLSSQWSSMSIFSFALRNSSSFSAISLFAASTWITQALSLETACEKAGFWLNVGVAIRSWNENMEGLLSDSTTFFAFWEQQWNLWSNSENCRLLKWSWSGQRNLLISSIMALAIVEQLHQSII